MTLRIDTYMAELERLERMRNRPTDRPTATDRPKEDPQMLCKHTAADYCSACARERTEENGAPFYVSELCTATRNGKTTHYSIRRTFETYASALELAKASDAERVVIYARKMYGYTLYAR